MVRSNHLGALATAVAAALAAVGVLGPAEVRPAEATFPGKNGKIALQSDRRGSYEIYTINRNGTKINKLTTNSLFFRAYRRLRWSKQERLTVL